VTDGDIAARRADVGTEKRHCSASFRWPVPVWSPGRLSPCAATGIGTSSGRTLPSGTYRWPLTARAADGDGALIAASGAETIIGTVEIDAT
jgi:hypothetical protein